MLVEVPISHCKSPERGIAAAELCLFERGRLIAGCCYFLCPCVMAATAVGLALAADGENCELRSEPSLAFNWNPDTLLPRKFAVYTY